jgi:metacaspase-1
MRKGLLIGINYIGTANELNGCINDVTNLKNLLINNRCLDQSELVIMTDKESVSSPLFPTKQNILDQMNTLVTFANSIPTDQQVQLFLAYSGHGSYVADTNGDETDGRDEVLCPLDYQQNGFIVDDYIRANFINKLGSNVTLACLFDSCHSGTVLDLKYTYKCDGKQTCVTQNNLTDTQCAVVMISGCRDDQTSADAYVARSYQGAMTASFLANYSNTISAENLVIKMKNWLKKNRYSQIPQLSAGRPITVTKPFVLAAYIKSLPNLPGVDLIQSAFYGYDLRILDVTEIVRNHFNSGKTILSVSNQLFTDPSPGKPKELRVVLTNSLTRIYPETWCISLDDIINDTLNQSISQIQSVVYGKNARMIDVTNIVVNCFTSGNPTLNISNRLFTDPYPRVFKELRVTLKSGKVNIFRENDVITLQQLVK